MRLKTWEIALIAALAITFLSGMYLNREERELSDKLIRLHVVANSDSEEDQSLKLTVRDSVLDMLEEELRGAEDRSAAEEKLGGLLDEIKACAEGEIRKNGYSYTVAVSLTEEYFPTTQYETFSLPAGEYLSLRIVIGEGEGHNWWCVVFPPLCSSAYIDTETAAQAGLTEDDISLITEDSTGYVIKFRTIELLEYLKRRLAGAE